MTEQETPDPVESAYGDALSGRSRDPIDLPPAKEITAIKGVPIEQVEQGARERWESVQKLRGKSDPEREAPQEQPEPPAEEAAPELLSEGAVVDYLFGGPEEPEEGPEPPPTDDPEAMRRELVGGEAAGAAVEAERQVRAEVEELKERLPGLDSDAFIEEGGKVFERLEEAYGDQVYASSVLPGLLEDLYLQLGGPARFGEIAEQGEIQAAYEGALAGTERDDFGLGGAT